MDIDLKTWLYDIITAIGEIDAFLLDVQHFDRYAEDVKTKRAVERNLEIIGEAMRRISKKTPAVELTNYRRIIDTRNRIIHGYDHVSDELIWGIVTQHLPQLKYEIDKLLNE